MGTLVQRVGLALLLMLSTGTLRAGETDTLFEGFDDFTVEPSKTDAAANRNREFGGEAALLMAYSYALDTDRNPGLELYDGTSRMQTLLRLHGKVSRGAWEFYAEGKAFRDLVYDQRGRERFDDRVIDRHASETEWSEVYLRGEFGSGWELKSGRQLLVWGRSDNLRVLDIINPLDLREPGSTDIEEVRLPVAMTRLHYIRGAWTFEGVAVHEVRFHKLPAPGSEFLPVITPRIPEIHPAGGWAAGRAYSVTGVFPGWDFSLNYARLWQADPWLDLTDPSAPILRHSRIRLAGFSFNRVSGAWLWKGEFARLSGIHFTNAPGESWRRADILLGVEYGGVRDTQIAVETSASHLYDWRRALRQAPDAVEPEQWLTALRITRSLAHDRVNLTLVSFLSGKRLTVHPLSRLAISYDVADGCTLELGLVLYGNSDLLQFGNLDDRDRLLVGLKYYF